MKNTFKVRLLHCPMQTVIKRGPPPGRIVLSCETRRFIVPEAARAKFAELYGRRIDIDAELSAAAAWCLGHQKRLHDRDFGRFINGWLLRAASQARPSLRLVSIGSAA